MNQILDQELGEQGYSGRENENSLSDIVEILNASGKEIKDTLNVIRNMASQTNILSINASIVAAKSNDSGREFRVIADEIRRLSDKSKTSADKIQQLITKMAADVNFTYDGINQIKQERIERQKLEMNLKSVRIQNELFNSILDQVGNKVEVKDPSGKFYLVNQEVAKDYGCPAKEILGKDDFAFFDHDTASKYWESEKEIIESRKDIISLEKVILNREAKYWLIKKIPIFIPEYEDWGLLIVQDNVESFLAEDEKYLTELKSIYPAIEILI